MLIQLRKIVVQPGFADEVIERFSRQGAVDEMKGFIDRTVMVNRRSKDSEEVVAMIRWESEEDWKNWEKSPVHIAGHREKRGQQPPEYVIESSVQMYNVKATSTGTYTP
ncbi:MULTISPECIES: antibiotic biosynthesis monooxygenase [unclassified Paenibacillus]|uniref:antibiotic biosynthesis monooxygenase n=1 Tax=unclassified Paenibacillus TaxID=185978 RepID=UPI002F3EA8BF